MLYYRQAGIDFKSVWVTTLILTVLVFLLTIQILILVRMIHYAKVAVVLHLQVPQLIVLVLGLAVVSLIMVTEQQVLIHPG